MAEPRGGRGTWRLRRRKPEGGKGLGFPGGALGELKRRGDCLSLARGSTAAVAVAVREEEGESVCPRWKGEDGDALTGSLELGRG